MVTKNFEVIQNPGFLPDHAQKLNHWQLMPCPTYPQNFRKIRP